MGRRSINTTKSGKYMNPTDQARKEARKKELKKNKKQRQMVRQAVLKGKDPSQLIEEMEKIDEMEYNVYQPSPLNEKVLREKRKKLQDTLHRVLRLYETDDPELWADLKRKEVEYDKRRNKRVQYFESVRLAESVQIDEIPLPSSTKTPTALSLPRIHIPIPPPIVLPSFLPPPGILKKPEETTLNEKPLEKVIKIPPGCPSGPPPNLLEMRELDSDYEWPAEEKEDAVLKKTKSIRFSDDTVKPKSDKIEKKISSEDSESVKTPNTVQQKMLELSGQNIDEFMKEMETVQKKNNLEKLVSDDDNDEDNLDSNKEDDEDDKLSKDGDDDSDKDDSDSNDDDIDDEKQNNEKKLESKLSNERRGIPQIPTISAISLPMPPLPMPIPNPAPLPSAPLSIPNLLPPSSMMFRPPPLRTTFYPPPGPNRSSMPGPPNMGPRMGIRMPPGPPPGLPPSVRQQQHNQHHNKHHHHHHHHHNHQQQHHNQHHHQQSSAGGNISAGPRISKDPKSATITAKPQIRNLSADVTRFVPSTLRVKRDEVNKKVKPRAFIPDVRQTETTKGPTKDDAYMQFMKEMQGLI